MQTPNHWDDFLLDTRLDFENKEKGRDIGHLMHKGILFQTIFKNIFLQILSF